MEVAEWAGSPLPVRERRDERAIVKTMWREGRVPPEPPECPAADLPADVTSYVCLASQLSFRNLPNQPPTQKPTVRLTGGRSHSGHTPHTGGLNGGPR